MPPKNRRSGPVTTPSRSHVESPVTTKRDVLSVRHALARLSAHDRRRLADRLGELRDVDEVMRRPGLLAEVTP